jgi:guanylate kinase
METKNKIIVLCAPSGAGKTSIYHRLLELLPFLAFSVSAITRPARINEVDGIDYYFMSQEAFRERIANGQFAEWEEVYAGTMYGTLHSEIERLNALGKVPLLDVDVKGAQSIKKIYGDNALLIFIKAPLETIKQRLLNRATDKPEEIEKRIARIPEEFAYESKCDVTVENINLNKAIEECSNIIQKFLA